MALLFYHSSTWRWMVAQSKKSKVSVVARQLVQLERAGCISRPKLFFLGTSAVFVGGCTAAALGLQTLTNPGTVDLGGSPSARPKDSTDTARALLLGGRPDAALIGKVNTARLGQMLEEIERKENTEDRYAAALRGETLLGPPNARHYASGSSAGGAPGARARPAPAVAGAGGGGSA